MIGSGTQSGAKSAQAPPGRGGNMEITKKQHDYGIDLLRILATFFICVLHVNVKCGFLADAPFMSSSYFEGDTFQLSEITLYQ